MDAKYTDEELAQIALATAPGMNPVRYDAILSAFEDALSAVRSAQEQENAFGFLGKYACGIRTHLRDRTQFLTFLRKLKTLGIRCVTRASAQYPPNLRGIDQEPVLLYAAGHAAVSYERSISVVGTRHGTRYGQEVTDLLVSELAKSGVTIVSGLAIGLDARAHAAALASGGQTVAVVAGGVDCGMPSDNRALAAQIAENGVIFSEYPPGTPVRPWMYAPRNRIVSGLTQGTLVVQARKKSGVMLTVDHAQEQGRSVFAVPGQITDPASYWPNRLIQQGAIPVLETRDILDEFGWSANVQSAVSAHQTLDLSDFAPPQRMILLALGQGPMSQEALCAVTNLSGQTLMAHLTSLEMEGIIEQFPGRMVQLCRQYRA